jgi:hypothetical protein
MTSIDDQSGAHHSRGCSTSSAAAYDAALDSKPRVAAIRSALVQPAGASLRLHLTLAQSQPMRLRRATLLHAHAAALPSHYFSPRFRALALFQPPAITARG